MHVWLEPFGRLRAPLLMYPRMDPFELLHDIEMVDQRLFLEHMFVMAPAAAYVGQWLQSLTEVPPHQRPGSFSLDCGIEPLSSPAGGKV